jgi:hypothetical protein
MTETTELIPSPPSLPVRRRGKVARLRSMAIPRRRRDPVNVNLIFPLTPLLWLCSPLILLALPVVNAVVIARRMDPRSVSLALSALPALSGLEVDVQTPRARVRVRFI